MELIKRIGLDETFISVRVNDGNVVRDSFGGNQMWLNSEIADASCGVIAAVNTYLYLIGKKTITQNAYISLCNQYCKKHRIDLFLIKIKFGALPISIGKEIKKRCVYKGVEITRTKWGINKASDQYQIMCQMLENDIPVLWGLFSMPGKNRKKLTLYTYKNGAYTPSFSKVESHYVVATAIYEHIFLDGSLKRMIEVSSWGKRYYVNFDEYLEFISAKKWYARLINRIGSNIMVITSSKSAVF